MMLCSPGGSSSSFSEGDYERCPEPLLLPCGLLSPNRNLRPRDILVRRDTSPLLPAWPTLESVHLDQERTEGEKSKEANAATAELKGPLQSEWDHLDPTEDNLTSYSKLLLWGCQFSQAGPTSMLETEEPCAVENLPGGSLPDSTRQQESKGNVCEEVSLGETLMESLSGDVPVSASIDTALEEEQQPQKALDAEGEDSSPASPQRQSVIQQSAQDKDRPHQGTGTKRPHPDDEDEMAPECLSSTSSYQLPFDAGKVLHVDGHDSGQDSGTSAGGCSSADKSDASQGKPYTCSECGEAFAWISNLMEHHKSHGSETCYVSQGC